MKKRVWLLCFVLLAGCGSASAVPEPPEAAEILPAVSDMTAELKKTYDMEYARDCVLSKYEPENGCYLGAYVLANPKIDYSMNEFERLTEKEHVIYSYYLKLGNELPFNWTLECMSKEKLPMIVITPSSLHNPFDRELLKKTAESFKQLNTPLLVQFFPNPDRYQFDSEDYIDFFQEAYTLFEKNAAKAAFVWSVSGEDKDLTRYYPGDEYTDWVGLSISEAISGDGTTYESDIFENLKYFYHSFQKTKPIMLSQLAISHYTSKNHSYYVKDAAEEITRIYSGLKNYPRIKAVVYMDFDNMQLQQEGVRDNFSITDNNLVLNAYSKAVSESRYLTRIANRNAGSIRSTESALAAQFMKSSKAIRKIGELLYISENSLKNDLEIQSTVQYDSIMWEGETFYSLESLKQKNMLDYSVLETEKKVRIF